MSVWEAIVLITWVFALVWFVPIGSVVVIAAAAIRVGRKKAAALKQQFKLEDDGA